MEIRQKVTPYFPPLVPVILFFILGVVYGYFVKINFPLLIFLISLSFILAWFNLSKERFSSYLIFIIVFLTGIIHFENKNTPSTNDISYFDVDRYRKISLKIKVSSSLNESYAQKKVDFLAIVLAFADDSNWRPISGRIKVEVFRQKPDFAFGDVLICRGYLIKPKRQFTVKSIYPSLVLKANKIEIIEKGRHPFRYIFWVKRKFKKTIIQYLPYPHQAILSALILGERQIVPREIRESFMRTGTVHILAISGLHVGMILYILYLFLKLLRLPRRISYLMLVFLISFYALLTGGNAPVARASIMAIVYLMGLILNREGDILNSLAFACWLILLFNPLQLFNVGFQLSFLVVFAILAFTPFIEGLFFKRRLQNSSPLSKIKKYFLRLFAVSLSAWIGSLGLVGYYFKMVNPMSILANILVVPLAFMILATGFLFLFSPSLLKPPFAYANLLSIEILIKSIGFLDKVPGGTIFSPFFSFPVVLSYYLFLGIAIFLVKFKGLPSAKRENFYS
ncbi:MAG: ComEC/Rec2 family competence protein [Candidatus Omnitrophica bacterium]|nr:ComEC/Rec2 family competence protein [Candidatus Omnitrophota bacterium]